MRKLLHHGNALKVCHYNCKQYIACTFKLYKIVIIQVILNFREILINRKKTYVV